mmetsp:Transcript_10177/g.17735  ORF Transcript_10177/g.17735 Transcript_10177/m.17735 type:complete len:86 (+) Transcript_10177:147-404(+)
MKQDLAFPKSTKQLCKDVRDVRPKSSAGSRFKFSCLQRLLLSASSQHFLKFPQRVGHHEGNESCEKQQQGHPECTGKEGKFNPGP